MKKSFLLTLILSLAIVSSTWAGTTAPKHAKGADWLLMSSQEKSDYLSSVIKYFENKGIPFEKPAGFYGSTINTIVDQPGGEKAEVMNLLLSVVYKDDPRSRTLIDKMKKPANKPSSAAKPVKPAKA